MSKLLISLRGNQRAVSDQWSMAAQQSGDYAKALGIKDREIEVMDAQETILVLNTSIGECRVFAKNVCTPDNDGRCAFGYNTPGWQTVLQARLQAQGQFSAGGGTTFFTTVSDKIHQELLVLLSAEEYTIVHEHVWP